MREGTSVLQQIIESVLRVLRKGRASTGDMIGVVIFDTLRLPKADQAVRDYYDDPPYTAAKSDKLN